MWSLGAGSRGGGKAPAGAGKDAEVALCGGFAADEALRMVPVQDTSLAGEGAGIMVARFDRAGKIIAMRPIGDVLAGGEPAVPKDGNVRAKRRAGRDDNPA
jgi:hypothetical protein